MRTLRKCLDFRCLLLINKQKSETVSSLYRFRRQSQKEGERITLVSS